jgi:mRNA-degrading endonuclease RelE of RelBE toxin-antitoxin system
LPEAVAAAVFNFIRGDLLDRPRIVGKPLSRELTGRWSARRGEYRVLYRINDTTRVVTVLHVEHRRAVYRRR